MNRIQQIIKINEEKNIRFRLTTIVLTLFCTLMLIVATFTVIGFHDFFIPAPATKISSQSIVLGILYKDYWYIPQIPVLLFIATFLGRTFGTISVLLYVLLGFIYFPIFAFGGGYHYILNYNCGYILAYVPTVFFVASYLRTRSGFWSWVKAALFAALIIHIFGSVYSILIGLIKQDSWDYIGGYVYIQSITRFFYDFVYGLLAIIIAKPFRKLLLMLIAP